MEISVVVPVYNEELNIAKIYERLKAVMSKINVSYELIFVNDGSRDNSIEKIKLLATKDNVVKYIDFSRNFGHQIAVTAGLDRSRGNAVVIIDADLQDPPELIEEMYFKMKEGFQVVYAKRINRKGESILKKWTAKIFYRILARITSISIPLDVGDFRIIDKKIVDNLRKMPEQEKYLRGQISWIGFNQGYIEYNRNPRQAGQTGYTLRKMIQFALDGITSFSDFPLKFASMAGFIVSGISFLMMLYALYSRFISKNYEPGWTSLMLTVLFLGGFQLIGIGIIGEYLSLMGNNVRKRPLYIISETNIDQN